LSVVVKSHFARASASFFADCADISLLSGDDKTFCNLFHNAHQINAHAGTHAGQATNHQIVHHTVAQIHVLCHFAKVSTSHVSSCHIFLNCVSSNTFSNHL